MAKKFSKMSLLVLGGVLLAVLFFVFGMSRREGFYSDCSTFKDKKSCTNYKLKDEAGNKSVTTRNCTWTSTGNGGSDGYCS